MKKLILLFAFCGALIGAEPELGWFSKARSLSYDDLRRFLVQKRYPAFDMTTVSNAQLQLPLFTQALLEIGGDFKTYGLPTNGPYSVTIVSNAIAHVENRGKFDFFGIRVREKWQDVKANDPTSFEEETPLNKAKAATIAYSRDFLQKDSAWTIHAAVFKDFNYYEGTPHEFSFVPSITLDKVATADTNKQVDSLVFRAGLQKPIEGKVLPYQLVRGAALFGTDTNFRSKVAGGEVEWEPFVSEWGIGTYHGFGKHGPPIAYRAQFFVHGEIGQVLDAGRNPNLAVDDGFIRIGPFVQLELKPTLAADSKLSVFNKLSIYARWQDFEALTSDTRSTRLFSTGLTYAFGEEDHFSVEVSYKNGRQALTEEKQELLELLFGVKF